MKIYGYDISHHNSDIKNYPMKDFVIVKATEGVGYVDDKFEINVSAAVKSGYKVIGAYHFVRADITANTSADEARTFINAVEKVNKSNRVISFLAIDIEGRSLSVDHIIGYCRNLISNIRDYTSMPVLVYVQASQIKRFESLCNSNDNIYLWLADWNCPTIAVSSKKWGFNEGLVVMHQIGVENKIDIDYADDSFLSSNASPTLDSRCDEINDILSSIQNDIATAKRMLAELLKEIK